ncbi:membrane protein [Lactobacillus delbrueckii subsp. bulgaricus]|nr:membrane protein [Lactobacillus delbrueckii subsp. bulgaricus]
MPFAWTAGLVCFLNHGLAIVPGQGFFVAVPAVYLAYGLLLYYYLASRAFYQEVKYA